MICVGDLHGNFAHLSYLSRTIAKGENLIQVGDFGLGFRTRPNDEASMDRLNATLAENRTMLYAIRGNHDDPSYWDGRYENVWSNIYLVADYQALIIDNKLVLFLGGAISIDRQIRREGVDYWKDEGFKYDEDKLNKVLRETGGVDVVIAHSSPSFCQPIGFGGLVMNYAENDKTLLDELSAEREELTRAFGVIQSFGKPDKWINGHFHFAHTEYIEDTKFILLDCGGHVNV